MALSSPAPSGLLCITGTLSTFYEAVSLPTKCSCGLILEIFGPNRSKLAFSCCPTPVDITVVCILELIFLRTCFSLATCRCLHRAGSLLQSHRWKASQTIYLLPYKVRPITCNEWRWRGKLGAHTYVIALHFNHANLVV